MKIRNLSKELIKNYENNFYKEFRKKIVEMVFTGRMPLVLAHYAFTTEEGCKLQFHVLEMGADRMKCALAVGKPNKFGGYTPLSYSFEVKYSTKGIHGNLKLTYVDLDEWSVSKRAYEWCDLFVRIHFCAIAEQTKTPIVKYGKHRSYIPEITNTDSGNVEVGELPQVAYPPTKPLKVTVDNDKLPERIVRRYVDDGIDRPVRHRTKKAKEPDHAVWCSPHWRHYSKSGRDVFIRGHYRWTKKGQAEMPSFRLTGTMKEAHC